ncbi:MAG TPA: CheR family methyltransferase [Thermoanaerobaculia bacterium]
MAADSTATDFTKLLDYLKASRGFDFSAYKMSSLMRRIQKRMREVGVSSYSDYTDYLEVHPNEFGPLFDTVLINVTGFFRDAEAWQFIQEQIIPRILEERGPDRAIRAWSAGCATGEEAFTVAMLLLEALGEEEFRKRVKIYATDADEGALALARQGSYEARQIAGVPAAMLEKYFDMNGSRHVFRSDLRRCLIFGKHDLIQDAAISRLDLLTCRNTLMYFNSETQEKILARFHFALNKTGYLFLGKAETLLAHSNSFRPVDLKSRLFVRSPNSNLRDRLLALSSPAVSEPGIGSRNVRIREAALDAGAVAQIAVDRRGHLALFNERARRLFGLGTVDLGRLFQDLELSYRPIELRSHMEEAQASRSAVYVKDVEWRHPPGESRQLEIHIVPLFDAATGFLGTSLSFLDFTHAHQLRTELERSNQELETAYEELQSANEELETTNEELQSTVEELETTNEELQSANEELETMNEELQSTNEELRSMNDQLQQRSHELDQLNRSMETILASLRAAVVVVDRALQVKVWSDKAEDLWGLRSDEVRGHEFLALDIGLPVRELEGPLRESLTENRENEMELDGINRRGRPVRCRVRCAPLMGRGVEGVILLMEEMEG